MYNPLAVINNIERRIANEPLVPMQPWYRGFTGTTTAGAGSDDVNPGDGAADARRYRNSGVLERLDSDGVVAVTELPIGKWTQDYKAHLLKLVEEDVIVRFAERHTERSVRFELEVAEAAESESESALAAALRLDRTISIDNMHAFAPCGAIKRYSSTDEIINDFFPVRLEL